MNDELVPERKLSKTVISSVARNLMVLLILTFKISALVQFNWGAFQDYYGLPSSPIFDKNFGPDFMHCWC